MERVFKIRTEKIFVSFRFFFTKFAILQYFISTNHAKFQNFFIVKHAKHAIVNRSEKFYNVL